MISSQSVSAEKITLQNATLTLIKKCTFSFRTTYLKICIFGSFVRLIKQPVHCCDALHFTETARDGRKHILFLCIVSLCSLHNKSIYIYIYIYELAVEFVFLKVQ